MEYLHVFLSVALAAINVILWRLVWQHFLPCLTSRMIMRRGEHLAATNSACFHCELDNYPEATQTGYLLTQKSCLLYHSNIAHLCSFLEHRSACLKQGHTWETLRQCRLVSMFHLQRAAPAYPARFEASNQRLKVWGDCLKIVFAISIRKPLDAFVPKPWIYALMQQNIENA